MGGNAAPPLDYEKLQKGISQAANAQTTANRPTINTPWANQSWEQGANGQWTMNTGFNDALGNAASHITQQAAQMKTPMDWTQFGQAQTGDQARDQAINAAYGQSASRLDPMWNQREAQSRTQLLNQGFDPSAEAYRNQMGALGQQRTDAYQSALNSAIGQGTAAGDSAFRNNMMARQQSIADALRQRSQPMQELQQLQGFLQMPGFNQDSSTMQGALGSANFAQQAQRQQWEEDQQRAAQEAQMVGAGMSTAGSIAAMLAMSLGSMF